MLSTDRKFHFIAELHIEKSRVLTATEKPCEDEVNWMFIKLENSRRSSFVYEILEPQIATYDAPFSVKIAFTFFDSVRNVLQINKSYPVMRGEEVIGTIRLAQYRV
jgi:hypothetical protein